MIDYSGPLQRAYFELLSDMISVPVYDRVPSDAPEDYVVLGTDTGVDDSTKTDYEFDATMTLSIFARRSGDEGGKKIVKDIAEEVINLVCEREGQGLNATPELNIITSTLEFATTLERQDGTSYEWQRVLRFRHKIEQLLAS